MSETDERQVLAGQAAYDLYKQGREAWNDWAGQHAGWLVDFRGWDFSNEESLNFGLFHFPGRAFFIEANFGDGDVSFYKANFGDGGVNFTGANFGDGRVSFAGTTFGKGDVNFFGVTFGDGVVNFAEATFGGGRVNFAGATFGNGDVHFLAVTFGDGNVDFAGATFGDRSVDFTKANFGNGEVIFAGTTFGKGDVNFFGVTFGDGVVNFAEATFGGGRVNFAGATFGNGDVHFLAVTFGDGNVDFAGVTFGKGLVNFAGATFGDRSVDFTKANFGNGEVIFAGTTFGDDSLVDFSEAKFSDDNTSFWGASFAGTTMFDRATFSRVPNFQQAHFGRDISIERMSVAYKQKATGRFLKRAVGPGDSSRFRRLRRMAVDARDHARELAFFARETRARYGHELNAFQYFPFFLYHWSSDFGRSLWRPVFGLFLICILAAEGLYHYSRCCSLAGSRFDAYMLALSNTMPFLNWGRSVRSDYLTALYGETVSQHLTVSAIMYSQGILSLLFIFLMGLALRNKLRL